MTPLATGWFELLIVILSAVMAYGWMVSGMNILFGKCLMPALHQLKPQNSQALSVLRREIDPIRNTERRKLIRLSILSS